MPTVTSKDGTTIGYDAVGEGPAVIVVYGAAGYRGSFGDDGELARLLAPHCTVYTYDRRGRGERDDHAVHASDGGGTHHGHPARRTPDPARPDARR